ncbi:MAG: ABC transporter permease [Firmicutes bacterium HGW-Firmicutes-1]|jgi:NitT/TauT family transport system permease protein|nr:MAG: ABC transporter permease [Firmicutes bacterium HGW-Firmicutes-1]
MMSFIIKNKTKLYAILFWVFVWYVVAIIVNRELLLPTPLATFKALSELVLGKDFWIIIGMSIYRVLVGFIISIIVGGITGIASGLNKTIYNLFQPIIVVIKSTPVLSFIIIALLWFGSSDVPIFICFLMCYPIVWTSVVQGIKQVDTDLLQMAKIYKVKTKYIIKNIYIPTIIPFIISGILSGLGLGWKVTVAAEVLSHPQYSIGANLHDAKIYLESEQLFAWTIVVIVLSMLFEYIFNMSIKLLGSRGVKRMTKMGEVK